MCEGDSMTKKIIVFNTGGTISMSESKETGAVSPTEKNPLSELSSLFELFADVQFEDLFYLPSPHITFDEMMTIRTRILQAIQQGYEGIVITHGTDTLEETAYFLELTIQSDVPICVTGAMRSSNEIGSDGLANLRSAIIVAASESSRNRGVLVVMNDEVHTSTYVTKTHTTNVATFQTPTFGPVGLVSKSEVVYFQRLEKREYYPVESMTNHVFLLKAYAGMDGTLIDALCDIQAKGLVIEALGAGNLPPNTVGAIRRCIQASIPVVFVSRAFNGVTQDVYDYIGGGKQFKKDGVIFTTGLSGPKARIKLSVLVSSGVSFDQLDQYFK